MSPSTVTRQPPARRKEEFRIRCGWVPAGDALYTRYHDEEWGVPVTDDRRIFEFLVLESAQAGLSWITVLRKRERYRELFAEFDPAKVALFSAQDIRRLLQDPGIIRNRLKVEAAVNNARCFLEVQESFGTFAAYIWQFVDRKPLQNRWRSLSELPAKTPVSVALSKDLKTRGFCFVGPTIIYAHMQAAGMVNDHTVDCFRHREVRALAKNVQV